MSEAEPKPVPTGSVFWFTGRISAKRYWAHVAGALAVLALAVVFLGIASDPRGSSDPAFLVLPLLGLFVWIVAAAMTQRLRDAGKPPLLAIAMINEVQLLLPELLELAGESRGQLSLTFRARPKAL